MNILLWVLSWLGAQAVSGKPGLEAERQQVLHALQGEFVAVEVHARGEARGHIRSRTLFDHFLIRDYWSQAEGQRIYAGTDVLQLLPTRKIKHWWFGSRGDYAYAEGVWTRSSVVLVVHNKQGHPLRRYRYWLPSHKESPLADSTEYAFLFRNDHAKRRGWKEFISATYRRSQVTLPADFQFPERGGAEPLERAYVGRLSGTDGEHLGRVLFDGEWLQWRTEREAVILQRNWLASDRVWIWTDLGDFREFTAKIEENGLVLRDRSAPKSSAWRRRDEWLPGGGYRVRTFPEELQPPAPLRVYQPPKE